MNRSTLWKVLLKLGCPEKFIALVRSLHDGMKARVHFNGTLSEPISVENGVKQGDIVALTLFTIYFAVVFLVAFYENPDGISISYRTSGKVFNLKRFLAKTKVSFSLMRELLYADDCDIVTHSEAEMQRFMDRFSYACKAFGFEISLKKTVLMHDPAPGQPYVEPSIYVEDKKFNVVHSFVYLGSTLTEGCSLDKEISLRIEKTSGSFSNPEKCVWSQHGIKLETKLLVYRVCVLLSFMPAKHGRYISINSRSKHQLMYKHQLKRFHQRCLRHILHIRHRSLGMSKFTQHRIYGYEKLPPLVRSPCPHE